MKLLRLKEFRLKANLTQYELSKMLNITQSGYSLWELGKRQPDAAQIMQLCKIFNCTPNDLFGIEGAMSVAFDPLFEEYKELREKLKK